MNFEYVSDDIKQTQFIDKASILNQISEEEIFAYVFGFYPVEFNLITSPLRQDSKPGCWFERDILSGKLFFRDFGYSNRPLDCFDVIKHYFKIDNFYKTLDFVYKKILKNIKTGIVKNILPVVKETKTRIKTIPSISKETRETQILIETRNFNLQDKYFWFKYGITRKNLIEDQVFPIKRYIVHNYRKKKYKEYFKYGYAITGFKNNRKKLYFPNSNYNFITNCKSNDIGNINNIPPFGRSLIITKSYKDCRVLRNEGRNVIWNQNEGMIPNEEVLLPIIKGFKKVIVLYDNDEVGIKQGKNLSNFINNHYPFKSKSIYIPTFLNKEGISDPADLYVKKSKKELSEFLKYNKV